MQTKTKWWIIAGITIALANLAFCCYRYFTRSQRVEATVEELDDTQSTHGAMVFFEPEVDMMMVGKWQHHIDTLWFRVYTTEPAEDDFCWGREWNEAEDIYEEDLTPYGNGWFKWKKTDNEVIEWHSTDNNSAAIPYQYKVVNLDDTELLYKESRDGQKQRFRKCE